MKLVFAFALLIALAPGGDEHARGVRLMQEGKFADAVVAFRAAAEAEPTNAELHYNLALALWRAGQPHDAEIAAEKAATLSDGALAPLRDGILGNAKMDAAQQKLGGEQPDLQAALGAAHKARDHFVHGAASMPSPELVRNLERALALIAEIEKKIEEQKEQEKKDDQKSDDEKSDDEKKEDEEKEDEKKEEESKDDKKDEQSKDGDKKDGDPEQKSDPKDDPSKSDDKKPEADSDPKKEEKPPSEGDNKDKPEPKPEQKEPQKDPQQEPQPGKENEPQPQEPKAEEPDKPEPSPQATKPGEDDKPEPKPQPGEEGADAKDAEQVAGALGQPQPERALSPEETKRLLERLQVILEQKAEMEKAQKAQRPRVKKDW